MVLQDSEQFLAKLQKGGRIQVPRLVRWKNRLEAGEIFVVKVFNSVSQTFYGRFCMDGRISIPKNVREELKIEPGHLLTVRLNPIKRDL